MVEPHDATLRVVAGIGDPSHDMIAEQTVRLIRASLGDRSRKS